MNWSACSTNVSGNNVPTLGCIFNLIQTFISWLLTFAGVVAVIFIIYAGIRFIASGGDPKQIEGAKKTLTYAIAGLLLVFLSFAIINFIAYATGAHCITLMGFSACM